MLDLSIIIVNWNVKGLLLAALKSIYKHTKGLSFEVFVSDNGSMDGSQEMVKARFPQVKLLDNGSNLGYPKANNEGIKRAAGRYVILLNPDTEVTEGSLASLIRFMDTHPEAGAVGPKLEYPDGSFQPSCRSFPTIETEFYRAFFLDQIFPKSKIFGKNMMSYWKHNDIREVDQPMGAALMVRRAVIDEVGMMDEGLVFWFDEVDWCKRIKNAGWKIFFTPQAKIYHHKNKSFVQWKALKASLKLAKIWRGSRNYYYRKHHGALSVVIVNLLDVLQIIFILAVLYSVGEFILRAFS
jgi:hypothetical protein